MNLDFFGQGLLIGFSIAAPVGAIGILCINRTLNQGRLIGLLSGLGAATADAVYGFVGGLGITFVSHLLISGQFWLRLLGGLFLCYLGGKICLSKMASQEVVEANQSFISAYISTFVLTLANPTTILSFAAVLAGLGLANTQGNYGAVITLVLGVFLGSALWWLLLSGGVSLLRNWFSPQKLSLVNYVCGAILFAFGILAFVGI